MFHQARSRGLVMIWVAILLVVFAGFVGLAIDTFYTVLTAQQLQIGADAAALAGVHWVRLDQGEARDAATALALANRAAGEPIELERNDANDEAGDIVIGRYRRAEGTFTPDVSNPNAVRVRARRNSDSLGGPLTLLFGYIFGTNTADVNRYAIGMVGGEIPVGMVCLDPSGRGAFHIQGNVDVLIQDGGVAVNSSHNDAVTHSGASSTLDVTDLYVTGGTDNNWQQVDFTGELFEGVPPLTDPLAALPEPNYTANALAPVVTVNNLLTSTTISPGYYRGITVLGGTLVMQPGVYIIDGPFIVGGNGNLTAPNVMIYATDSGYFNIGGTGNVTITPMASLSYPAGPSIPEDLVGSRVALFQSRGNPNSSSIGGTSGLNIGGRVYMPDNSLTTFGNGGTFGTGLIAYRISVQGNGTLTIGGDPFIVEYPQFVFLVE